MDINRQQFQLPGELAMENVMSKTDDNLPAFDH